MPKTKLCLAGFKSVTTCPCGYTVVASKGRDDLGTQKDGLRMKLHEKKCPKATKEKSYEGIHNLIPNAKVFQIHPDEPEKSRRVMI
jgi:hypothetical protein